MYLVWFLAYIHTYIHMERSMAVDIYGKKLSPEDIASARKRGGLALVQPPDTYGDSDVHVSRRSVSMYVCMYVCIIYMHAYGESEVGSI
jgi:hypothetical protein